MRSPIKFKDDAFTNSNAVMIEIKGKFKSINLFNNTLHIIIYPEDGLRAAVKLQELDEGTELTVRVKDTD